MENIYSKTYEIESDRLENISKLQFSENSAMITCQDFSDFNTLLDILYIEGFTKSYDLSTKFVGINTTNGLGGSFIILLAKKNISERGED